MIDINLDPNVHLGPLSIAWHGIFTAVGIFFGVGLPLRLLKGRVSEEDGWAVATWGVIGGILGARIVHVIDQLPYYLQHPEQILFIWTGGIAVWGAAIGGVIGGFVAAIRRGVPIGYGADAAAPGIALGFAIGRIGDIINGEHHATPCDAPVGICVTYSHPDTLGQGPTFPDGRFSPGPVHLAVAYDLVWNLAGAALTLWLRRFTLPDGLIFWIWAVQYATGRLLFGFMRVGEPSYAFGLRQDQIIAILVYAAAIPMIIRLTSRGRIAPRTVTA